MTVVPSVTLGEAEALRRLSTLEPLRMSPMDALAELAALVDLATGVRGESET
jgi:hypothetical protein